MKPQNHHTLPEGWVKGLFKDLAIIEMGQSPEGDTYNSTGAGIALLNGPTEFTNRYPVRVQWTSKPTKVCKTGDILICVRGSSTGRINISDDEYCIGRGVAAIRANRNSDTLFLEYQLTFVVQHILKLSAGSTFPNIDKNSLSKINVSIPPLPEQRQIAAVLGTWDRAIEQTTELLKVLRTRHRGLMHQLLTGKKRLPGFESEWRKDSYDELLKEVKRNVRFDDNALYHLISVRRRSGGLFHRQSLYGHQILTKNLRQARNGDFLFSKMQIVHGASGLTTKAFDGMMISGSYIAVVARDKDVLDIEFFNWLSQLPYFYHQTWVSSYGVHIEKMTFDFEAFLGLSIEVPPTIDEQRAIAHVLDASLTEIRQQEAKLYALREQKRGLMQCLLTGQVRVPLPADMA